MPDLNSDALGIWEHLKPAIDKEIEQKTRGMVQRRKMKVTTAPSISTGTIGVTEAFGSEMVIPFATNLISATVGDMVWVEFMYGATNAFASMFASADEKDWDVAGDLSVGGNAGISGNLDVSGSTSLQNTTVNGVLDVTQRRCEATKSAAGWYRAIVYNAYDTNSAQGASGEIVTIRIVYTSFVSVQHEISLFMTKGKVAFLNETSHGTTNLVDKIRYTYAGAVGYVDIHITSSSSVRYTVCYDVASAIYAQSRWSAGTLALVDDSPSGETVLTEHTLTTDGVKYQTFTAYGKTWTFRKYGNVVYVDAPDAMTPTTSGGNSIGTLPSEFRPAYTTRLVAANAEGAYKVLLISTDGSVSAFCYTTVGQSTPYSITGSYLAI